MTTEEPKSNSNVHDIGRAIQLSLEPGDVLPDEVYEGYTFMLRTGSIAVEVVLSTVNGPVKKRVALLDHQHDLFGHERDPLAQHVSGLKYVAIEQSTLLAIPNSALNRILRKPANEERTVGERVIQVQEVQIARLLIGIIHATQREDSALNQANHALRSVATSVEDARREEREARAKSERQIEESKKAIIDQLQQEKAELEAQLEAERAKFAKLEREHRELLAYNETVCAEFRETTGAFHAWIAKQHQDSEEFVRLLNMFQKAQGLPELTHEEIFGVMSGRGLHPEVGFAPEEAPTAQSPIEERIPVPPPATPPPVVISTRSGGPEAPTRREGPPPRRPMQTLTGLGGLPSSKPTIPGSGTMVQAKPIIPREETVELDLRDVALIPDEQAPLTMVTPRFDAPPVQPEPDEEEPELDEYGFPIRRTLVGLGSLVPESIPEDQLPPEFRKNYGGKL